MLLSKVFLSAVMAGGLASSAAGEETAPTIQLIRVGDLPAIPNGIVSPPRLVSYTYPAFTEEARSRGLEGTVTIEAGFDTNGNFEVLRVVKGLGSGLDESAIAVLQDWRFLPASRNGVPISVIAQIDVQFNRQNDWYRVGSGISPPRIIERVEAQYSDEARSQKLNGKVVLEAFVGQDGNVKVMRVIRSVGSGLDENAIKAIEQWKFNPGTKESKPVSIKMNVEVNFNLR